MQIQKRKHTKKHNLKLKIMTKKVFIQIEVDVNLYL